MPSVYDKNGHELTVGARVARKRLLGDECAVETIRRIVWQPRRGWCVFTGGLTSVSAVPADGRDQWEFPDLLLIDSPTEANPHTKEAASAAPEGAEQ
jgi:hypothetical protein